MRTIISLVIPAALLLSLGTTGCYTRLATTEEEQVVAADTVYEETEGESGATSESYDEEYWDARTRYHMGFHFYYPWRLTFGSYYDPWYWDYHIYSPWYGWSWPTYSWYYGPYSYYPYAYYRPYFYGAGGYYPYLQPVIYYPAHPVAGRYGTRDSGVRRTGGERGISAGRGGSASGRVALPSATSSSGRAAAAPRSRDGAAGNREVQRETRGTSPSGRGDRAVTGTPGRGKERPATRSTPPAAPPRRESTAPPSRPERRESGESKRREQSSRSSSPAPSYQPAPSSPPSGSARSAPSSGRSSGSEGRSSGSRRSRD